MPSQGLAYFLAALTFMLTATCFALSLSLSLLLFQTIILQNIFHLITLWQLQSIVIPISVPLIFILSIKNNCLVDSMHNTQRD